MKMMHGACALPCSNRSRTRLAPTPTNISTKSEPDIEKNGRPASPATARASSVLPVPGGPTSSAPFGSRPPSFVNFAGSLRNSMISSSSTFASSHPATSANVTFGVSPASSFAFDLPNENAFAPPACICRMMKIQMPIITTHGRMLSSSAPIDARASSAETCTFCARSRSRSRSPICPVSFTVNRFALTPPIDLRRLELADDVLAGRHQSPSRCCRRRAGLRTASHRDAARGRSCAPWNWKKATGTRMTSIQKAIVFERRPHEPGLLGGGFDMVCAAALRNGSN